LLDTNGQLQNILNQTQSNFPYPDYQWIEDRFWVWIHYALLKIGRGEFVEAFDFSGFLRMAVLGPMLHIKNNRLPRGVRKVEMQLGEEDLNALKLTLPGYERQALLDSLRNAVAMYRKLRILLFSNEIIINKDTEQKVMVYFDKIEQQETK
jgi:hypothetical protein